MTTARTALILSVGVLLGAGLAGCVAPPQATATLPANAAEAVGVRSEPFQFEGNLGAGAFACAVVQCIGGSTPEKSQAPLNISNEVTAVDVTLTWSASSEATGRLRLGLSWNETGSHEFHTVDGASPLRLNLTDLRIRLDEKPYFWVFVPEAAGLPVYVKTPQSFQLTGTIARLG